MEFFLKDSIFIILKTFLQFIKSFHHTENPSSSSDTNRGGTGDSFRRQGVFQLFLCL